MGFLRGDNPGSGYRHLGPREDVSWRQQLLHTDLLRDGSVAVVDEDGRAGDLRRRAEVKTTAHVAADLKAGESLLRATARGSGEKEEGKCGKPECPEDALGGHDSTSFSR